MVEVESRRSISTCRNRFRCGDEKRTPRIDFGSLSNQLLIQYSFLCDITFHLHAPCPIPDRPFALFATSLFASFDSFFLVFFSFFCLFLTVFSRNELSYPRPDRGSVNVDMCCIISRYFDTPRRRLSGPRRYCGILNRELR